MELTEAILFTWELLFSGHFLNKEDQLKINLLILVTNNAENIVPIAIV